MTDHTLPDRLRAMAESLVGEKRRPLRCVRVPWGVVLSLHEWRNVARRAVDEKDEMTP